jgi:KaiC/GvpD/RAD55 family RecA-like ATPase
MNKSGPDEHRYLPNIRFLDTIFLSNSDVVRDSKGGFRSIDDARGFPKKSSILITGKPGVGKAYFTLAMVRELMRCKSCKNHQLWYVRIGSRPEGITDRYRGFGWFAEDDPIFSRDRAYFVDISEGGLPQPTKGAEELINPVLVQLRKLDARNQECDGIFVVVDSLTSLVKDSLATGDRRRNIDGVIDGIEHTLKSKLALNLLIVEGEEPEFRGEVPAEEHIADFVFHLKIDDVGDGRRARILDVSKTPDGTSMLLGSHSWYVYTRRLAKSVIAAEDLRDEIELAFLDTKGGPFAESKDRFGTIVVAPYPRLPDIGRLQDWEAKSNRTIGKDSISTGTPGLDEMLLGDSDYWARPVEQILADHGRKSTFGAPMLKGLYEGSTTLLLGRSGTGKTICCLQFLAEHDDPKRCLYINFENRPHRIVEWFPADGNRQEAIKKTRVLYRRRAHLDLNILLCEIQFIIEKFLIERVAIDGLSDLLAVLGSDEYTRLVEDLLVSIRNADYKRRHPARKESKKDDTPPGAEPDGQIEADLEESAEPPITIYMSLEADASDSVLSRYGFDSFADNVLVLEQLIINDEQRKTIQVLKARGRSPDRLIREIMILNGEMYPLRIVPGLETYRNLAQKVPKPIRVTLQLIGENRAQRSFNKGIPESLTRLFGYEVSLYGFARDEIVRTLLDIASGVGRIPYSDIKLLSIDEWWIRELRLPGLHEPGKHLSELRHPLLRLNDFLTRGEGPTPSFESYSSDFWLCEIEKATVPRITKVPVSRTTPPTPGEDETTWKIRADAVALPSYLDFGLFCVNARIAGAVLDLNPCSPGFGWKEWIEKIPLRWAGRDGSWFVSPDASGSRGFLVDLMAQARAKGHSGFSFDMETTSTMVCSFLEFCWAFGAPEDTFISPLAEADFWGDEAHVSTWIDAQPAAVALRFLAFLVLEGLMPSRTTLRDAGRSMFSRHWYSSLDEVDRLHFPSLGDPRLTEGAEVVLHPIPFFPMGSDTLTFVGLSDALCQSLLDALRRFDRLLARLIAAIHYRAGLDVASSWATELASLSIKVKDYQSSLSPKTNIEDILRFLKTSSKTIRDEVRQSRYFLVGQGILRRDEAGQQRDPDWSPVFPLLNDSGPRYWRRLPAAMFMDLRDVNLLLDWHDFRVSLLEAEWNHQSISSVLAAGTPRPEYLDRHCALTGYACEGSWLVGVDRSTRSPSLAAKFLTELTSAEHTKQRAEAGAGIPSRKDFYDFYGDDIVPRFPAGQMTWKEFLKLTGSRARRRERCFCPRLRVSEIFDEIHKCVLHCLSTAASYRDAYRSNLEEREKAIEAVSKLANRSILELDRSIASRMVSLAAAEARRVAGESPDAGEQAKPFPCLTCPSPSVCRRIFDMKPMTGDVAYVQSR